ncbi:hypothetical protein PIB30_002718 [Stylosanthes scabra]|uniref:non-specific serine/threonine protein kinase n=1 Tax=Stylosanthes scabra TaxID=79078 RepID=A0ABU6R3T8_9FABA|nr:hypothetical protein [Stylosanthes scabra]
MEETEACAKDSPLVLLKQGAEARVFESNFVGRRSVIKERFSKKYRHPTLDSKLTLRRLNAEARCMTKARKLGSGTNQLVLIDFGLSFTSTLPEDKAVDLYVLERALLSMHSSCGNVMDRILAAYRKSSKQWSSTLNKLAQVRQRGRKRTMVG